MNRKEKYHLWKNRMEDFEARGDTIHEWVAKKRLRSINSINRMYHHLMERDVLHAAETTL